MKKSTELAALLESLHDRARQLGFTDTEWAARAGIRKETLSRLRGRPSCDFATLNSLASVVGAAVGLIPLDAPACTPDGQFPAQVDRDYEERLLDLCASGDREPARWRRLGPAFFMAGLAVMVASAPEFDRRSLLDLAEKLHVGSSQVVGLGCECYIHPIRPSRFLPMLSMELRRAAR